MWFWRSEVRGNQEKEVEDEDNYRETDSLLGNEHESENDGEDISIRSKTKKKKGKKERRKEKKASLVAALWNGLFGATFAIGVICRLLHDALLFVQPQLLR